ncbi:MAG: LysR substrate-binding domain-containing protein [Desulfovibrionaceae bacterium]
MDFRKLSAFCKVYETGSFSLAAEALELSQPTVSSHVAALEKEFGQALFDRLARRVMPTPAGQALYERVRGPLAEIMALPAELSALRGRVAGELALGASNVPGEHLLPVLLADFLERHPGVSVQLRGGDSATVLHALERGEVPLGVTGRDPGPGMLTAQPLWEDELVVVGAPGFEPDLDRFEEQPWVLRPVGSGTRHRFAEGLAAAGRDLARLRVAAVAPSNAVALRLAACGVGLTAVSRLSAQAMLDRGELRLLNLGLPPMPRRYWLVRLTGRSLAPCERIFMDFLISRLAG